MNQDLSVIIGIGGIGRAIARRTGGGSKLLLADYQTAALDEVAEQMRGDGFSVSTQQVDVSSRSSVAAVAAAARQLGKVTRLVCTAGVAPVHANAETVLAVNLLGAAYVVEEFAEVIATGGTGVVIASNAGYLFPQDLSQEEILSLATMPAEALSKTSLVSPDRFSDPESAYGFAKQICRLRVQAAAAGRWAQQEARINSISPGVISTPMGRAELVGKNQSLIRKLIDSSSLKRAGIAEEIASVAAFLLGPESSFITGSDILADGGAVAAIKIGHFRA